jgi:transcriptional regulator with XRE-family HTH domain
MSGSELAKKAHISRDAVSSYTTMRSIPSGETLAKIAKALACKPVDLMPPLSEEELNTLIEVREYSQPGMKLLIARVPLPADLALKIAAQLEERSTQKKKR